MRSTIRRAACSLVLRFPPSHPFPIANYAHYGVLALLLAHWQGVESARLSARRILSDAATSAKQPDVRSLDRHGESASSHLDCIQAQCSALPALCTGRSRSSATPCLGNFLRSRFPTWSACACFFFDAHWHLPRACCTGARIALMLTRWSRFLRLGRVLSYPRR